MFEGFDFGTPTIATQLTGILVSLKKYTPITITPEYFEAAMGRLRGFLDVSLQSVVHPASLHPPPLPAPKFATRQKTDADAATSLKK